MTLQETFDRVYTHLLTQGQQSTGPYYKYDDDNKYLRQEIGCAYRLGDLKCAAGCLIEDDEYQPRMEGCTIWSLLYSGGFKFKNIDENNKWLVTDLQRMHDGYAPCNWIEQLTRIAKDYKLTIPEVKDVHPNCRSSCD